MKKLKKALLVCHIYHKRLILRPTFIILLALVPVIGLLLGLVAHEDSGIMTVYLAYESESEAVLSVIDDLTEDEGIIRFVSSDKEGALRAVENGKADSAWVLKEDFDSLLQDYAEVQSAKNSLVTVFQRDDDVSIMLAREKLLGAIYPLLSREFYLSYAQKDISSEIDEALLLEYYDSVMPEGEELFEISTLDGENAAGAREISYLVLPMRGLLSVMVVLAGLSVAMAYKTDEKRGIFCRVPRAGMPIFVLGYYIFAVLDVCIAMLISLLAAGMMTDLSIEVITLILLAVASVLFSVAIERLCRNIGALCAITPVVIIALIVVCPVFFNIDALYPIQLLLPPYYYLNGVYNGSFIIPMVTYIAVMAVIDTILILFTHDTRKLA